MTHVFRTLAEARTVEGSGYRLRELLGRSTDVQLGPEGYLVEREPNDTLGAHFHDVDQYQVFFGSPGATYQRRPISTVMVHYTDAYTTYGPFGAGATEALRYFTVRATHSTVHGPMPESRDRLPYRGRRQWSVDLGPFVQADVQAERHRVETLIERAPDGLAAFVVQLGPHAQFFPPAHDRGGGRAYCVIDGELLIADDAGAGDRKLGPCSLGWSTRDSGALCMSSGEGGCRVLLLDYPHPPTPESHPEAP